MFGQSPLQRLQSSTKGFQLYFELTYSSLAAVEAFDSFVSDTLDLNANVARASMPEAVPITSAIAVYFFCRKVGC